MQRDEIGGGGAQDMLTQYLLQPGNNPAAERSNASRSGGQGVCVLEEGRAAGRLCVVRGFWGVHDQPGEGGS
jgi:hypothetical protein